VKGEAERERGSEEAKGRGREEAKRRRGEEARERTDIQNSEILKKIIWS